MTNIVFKMCSSGFAGAVEVLSRIFERVLALICFLTFTTHIHFGLKMNENRRHRLEHTVETNDVRPK